MTINVTKYRLNPDRVFAGTRGSFGMEKLSFNFGDGWDFDTVSVTFHPQRGKPIRVPILSETVEIDIPAEVMAHSGESRFVVSGVILGDGGEVERKAITLEGYVDVAYTADDKGGNTRKVTADVYDQLIDQATEIFNAAREDVERSAAEAAESAAEASSAAKKAAEKAQASERAAKTSEENAAGSAASAGGFADAASAAVTEAVTAKNDAIAAKAAAETAKEETRNLAETAEQTVKDTLEDAKESGEFDGPPGDTPYIGENGNWWIGDIDTGVTAQSSAKIELDTTLTESGKAADAKAVGNKLVKKVTVATHDGFETLEYPRLKIVFNDDTTAETNLPKPPKVYEILMLEAAPISNTVGYTGQFAYVDDTNTLYVCTEGYSGEGLEFRETFFWSPVEMESPYIIKKVSPTETDYASPGTIWINIKSGDVYVRCGSYPLGDKWVKISLPETTSADEGKVLTVVNGVPKWADGINVTYDETTGNLTITSSSGGVSFDETTGNLTIGG